MGGTTWCVAGYISLPTASLTPSFVLCIRCFAPSLPHISISYSHISFLLHQKKFPLLLSYPLPSIYSVRSGRSRFDFFLRRMSYRALLSHSQNAFCGCGAYPHNQRMHLYHHPCIPFPVLFPRRRPSPSTCPMVLLLGTISNWEVLPHGCRAFSIYHPRVRRPCVALVLSSALCPVPPDPCRPSLVCIRLDRTDGATQGASAHPPRDMSASVSSALFFSLYPPALSFYSALLMEYYPTSTTSNSSPPMVYIRISRCPKPKYSIVRRALYTQAACSMAR